MQSGLWRDNYGDPSAHMSAVRGVSIDGLNKIVISGGSDGKIKFWPFKCKGNLLIFICGNYLKYCYFRNRCA